MSKWVMNLTWQDAPHLNKADQAELLASYAPHERDARSKGTPQLGSGAIFPISEEDVVVDVFKLPEHWARAYAFDVGWKKSAAVFGAYDNKTDTWYIYSEYYRGYAEPSVHADAISARGKWMRGVIDSAAHGMGQDGSLALFDQYSRLGLDLSNANKSVEAGLLEVYQRLSSGRLKFFSHLSNLLAEFRIYRRDSNGKIVKKNDHLMDALRYLMMSGMDVLEFPPGDDSDQPRQYTRPAIGRNGVSGY